MLGWRRLRRFAPAAVIALTCLLSAVWIAQGAQRIADGPSELLSEEVTLDVYAPAEKPVGAAVVANQVLARNMFDSRVGPMSWDVPAPVVPEAPTETEVPDGPLERCSADLRLLASVVRARHPERSMALLRHGSDSNLVPIGGMLGDARLLALRPQRAVVQQADGGVCMLPVFLSAEERKALSKKHRGKRKGAKKPKRARKTSKGGLSRKELDEGIRPAGQNRYVIDRGLLAKALTNPGALRRGARFRPHKESGRTVGLRLLRVLRSSAFYRLGVRRGDVIRSLNGYDLASPDGMLNAYSLIKRSDSFTLAITRKGKPMSIQLEVQ